MVVRRRSLEVDVAVRQHPDWAVGVLRLQLQVPAVLEVHQHRVVVAVVGVGVGGPCCRTCPPVLLLLLLLLRSAGLALALAGGALPPSGLDDITGGSEGEGYHVIII